MLERLHGRGEFTFAKIDHGEIEEKRNVIRRERQSLTVVRSGAVEIAFGEQELRGSVVRGGHFRDGRRISAARVNFEMEEICGIHRAIANRAGCRIGVPCADVHARRADRRRGISQRRWREIVSFDSGNNGLRDSEFAGGSFAADAAVGFDDIRGHDAPAILQHNRIRGSRRHGKQ